MKTFIIKVKMITKFDNLDYDDQEYFENLTEFNGIYYFDVCADDEESALDEFHETIPIACLDDFAITVEVQDED